MSLSINNYLNLNNQVVPFREPVLQSPNMQKQEVLHTPDKNSACPSLSNLQAYSFAKPSISFGKIPSHLKERASRLVIRNSKYPDEFKNDLVWALGLDKLIRKYASQLKTDAIRSMDELTSGLAKDYRQLKQTRDIQLSKEWYRNLSPRDKKIADHLYEVSFYPERLDLQKLEEIFALGSTDPKAGEVLQSYDINQLNREKFVGKFNGSRLKGGVDIYGTSSFGEFRPIADPYNHGTIVAKKIETEKEGSRFCGRKFVNYVRLYDNPEFLQTLGTPKRIHVKDWESPNNPISAVISRNDLPEGENQHLLVYTHEKPSEVGNSPITSTTVIFSQKPGKKPELTSVVWKMPEAEDFPAIQKHLGDLFSEYAKYKDTANTVEKRAKIIEIVAEVQWYFHQMMPYKRGSAALGDAVARILMEAAGLKLSRWKVNVMPDIETFVTSKNDFIQNYSRLFEIPPHFAEQEEERKLKVA